MSEIQRETYAIQMVNKFCFKVYFFGQFCGAEPSIERAQNRVRKFMERLDQYAASHVPQAPSPTPDYRFTAEPGLCSAHIGGPHKIERTCRNWKPVAPSPAQGEGQPFTIDDAMKFEQLRNPRPQTNREIWQMMVDFANEQREAARSGREPEPTKPPAGCTCEYIHRSDATCPSKAPSNGSIKDAVGAGAEPQGTINLQSEANELLRKLNREAFVDALDIEQLPHAVGLVEDFAKAYASSLRQQVQEAKRELSKVSQDFQQWLSRFESGELDKESTRDAENRAERAEAEVEGLRRKLAAALDWFIEEFGDHDSCPVCGTDCQGLFVADVTKADYSRGCDAGLEAAAQLVEDFSVANVKAEAGGKYVNLAHRQPLAAAIRAMKGAK